MEGRECRQSYMRESWRDPIAGPTLRFGLPKPVTILVAHLLLNIKKHHKSPKNLFMQNKCYIMFLA